MADLATHQDFFSRVRKYAVALLIAAGAAAIVGSLIDWVVIAERPQLRGDVDFGDQNQTVEEPEVTEPFTGVEAGYGLYSLIGGAALVGGGIGLALRRRSKYAWLGFAGSVVAGGIAIAAYRGVADQSSPLYQNMDIVGRAEPAAGLTLVSAGAIIGLIAAVLGVAATPSRRREELL